MNLASLKKRVDANPIARFPFSDKPEVQVVQAEPKNILYYDETEHEILVLCERLEHFYPSCKIN